MFYLIDKPKGVTSFKAIRDFAKANQINKIGHTGTLDPIATGLLLVATEQDTAFIDYLDKGQKTYIAQMQFGFSSPSYDIDGQVIKLGCAHNHTIKDFEQAITKNFLGKISQVPPVFSAKKINGQRAYDLARQGKEIAMKPQNVEIFKNQILSWNAEQKILEVEYVVSRGTYIRSLIHDLAKAVFCSAIMIKLQRSAIGSLKLEQAGTEPINVFSLIDLPSFEVNQAQLLTLLKGIRVKLNTNIDNLAKILLVYKEELIGIGTIEKNILTSKKLLGNKIAKLL